MGAAASTPAPALSELSAGELASHASTLGPSWSDAVPAGMDGATLAHALKESESREASLRVTVMIQGTLFRVMGRSGMASGSMELNKFITPHRWRLDWSLPLASLARVASQLRHLLNEKRASRLLFDRTPAATKPWKWA